MKRSSLPTATDSHHAYVITLRTPSGPVEWLRVADSEAEAVADAQRWLRPGGEIVAVRELRDDELAGFRCKG